MIIKTGAPIAATFGGNADPLVISVDDAWFEGDPYGEVPDLDGVIGIRQCKSLSELHKRCKHSSKETADLPFLTRLVELCQHHHFRLMLCNFEHLETAFAALNQIGQAILYDVNYAARQDGDYAPKLLARLLNGRRPKADMFFVTGFPDLQSLFDRHANDPQWYVLHGIKPIVDKTHPDLMRTRLAQFAANFVARARNDRYQFWAKPGDNFWTIVFNGQQTIQAINVETTYLSVFVAHPGCHIHVRWLDIINEAAHEHLDGAAQDTPSETRPGPCPSDLRLFLASEFLRRKVTNLSHPPSCVDDSSVILPERPLEAEDPEEPGADRPSADGDTPWSGRQALPSDTKEPLPDGCHSVVKLSAAPATLREHLQEMLTEYKDRVKQLECNLQKNPTADPAELEKAKALLAEAIQFLPTIESKAQPATDSTPSEIKTLRGRVNKAYTRSRTYFTSIEGADARVVSALADHFSRSLLRGYTYTPGEEIKWACRPSD